MVISSKLIKVGENTISYNNWVIYGCVVIFQLLHFHFAVLFLQCAECNSRNTAKANASNQLN